MIIRAMLIVALLMTSMQAAAIHQRRDTTDVMQGSVDVVISTRDGFVLATDSRLTRQFESQITYTDDTQKLYPIGAHTACVVAGVQGATRGTDILQAAASVGATFISLNKRALQNEVSAAAIKAGFAFALELIGHLIDPRYQSAGLTAELSFVSVNSDGTLDWNSARIPFVRSSRESALTAGTPIYTKRLRKIPGFDIEVIGQRAVANSLLSATRSGHDRQSRSKMMRRYYRWKNAGQLDRFTLDEAVVLARELVQATIDLAPRSAGVGGPVDIATLNQSGFR